MMNQPAMNQPAPAPKSPHTGAFVFAGVIIALFFIGLMGLLYYGVQRSDQAGRDALPSPLIGKPAPAFALRKLASEEQMTQQDLIGRPLLVNFWASWCAACRDEHPLLMRLAGEGVEIVGFDYKDSDAEGLRWLQRHGNPYRSIAADPEGRAGLDWGVYGVPETYVLDAEGRIVYKQIGPLTEAVWREKIQPLMQGPSS